MRSGLALVMGAIAVAAVAASWSRSPGQAPAPAAAPATRVAVCDVQQVLDAYQRRADLEAQFKATAEQLDKEDRAREQKIERLQNMVDKDLTPGSKEHARRQAELERLKVEREVWARLRQKELSRRRLRLMEGMYAEVVEAIAATARQKGYDLVMTRENIDIGSKSVSELLTKIAQRKCLYRNPAIDLSRVVSDRLNRSYRARQGG